MQSCIFSHDSTINSNVLDQCLLASLGLCGKRALTEICLYVSREEEPGHIFVHKQAYSSSATFFFSQAAKLEA